MSALERIIVDIFKVIKLFIIFTEGYLKLMEKLSRARYFARF